MATKAAKKGAEAEINRLRAQVRDLQAQLAGSEPDEDERDSDREAGREDTRARRDDDRDYRDDDRFRSDVRIRKYRRAADEATDTAADLPVRLMDEAGKLARALTFAYLEQLSAAADVFISFADEVTSRNRPQPASGQRRSSTRTEESRSARSEERESDRTRNRERTRDREKERGSERSGRRTITGLASDLPADISSGFLRALNRSLDIPGRTVERFQSVYRETEEEAEPSLRPQDERDERNEDTRRRTAERERSESRPASKQPRSRSQRATTRRSPISAEREEEATGEAA